MTQEELQQLVEKISIESFHLPFRHRAVFNARLRSTGGRYHLSDHHLDFNLKMFKEVDEKTKIGIIKHELCHYHLHLRNKGYRHQDADFKNLLKKLAVFVMRREYLPIRSKKSNVTNVKIVQHSFTANEK